MSQPDGGSMAFQPLYYADRVTVINPTGDVGLVTLWTPLRTAMRVLGQGIQDIFNRDASRIAVIANLYGDGMHEMFCNLLFNPQIRYLVAIGEDLGLPTTDELDAFLERGLEEVSILGTIVHAIPGTTRFFPVLANFDVKRLQQQLTFRHLGKLTGDDAAGKLARYLDSLPRLPSGENADRRRVEIPAPIGDDYAYRPSDVAGHQVARRRPLDCWEELITRTVRFGHPVHLRSGPRIELLNTKVTITDPSDDPEDALKQYGFSLERFRSYQDKMLDSALPPGISYTYGNRLRGYFSRNGESVDTLDSAVSVLQRDPESRRAYITLWDSAEDLSPDGPSAPCLVTIFFRRSEGRLTLTATYRAHNLLVAWLQNVYGLMRIQQEVCRQVEMPPGALTVISHSLGIDPRNPRYELAKGIASAWDRDEDVDRVTGKHSLREDPNGYFIVTVDEGSAEIVAEHRYGGLLVKQYRGDRAAKIEREIIGDMAVSLVSHGLWLGRELALKEQALRRKPGQHGSGAVS
jgi:thymidylate synthase (methanogen type)